MNFSIITKVGWVERSETQQIPTMLPQTNLQISIQKVGWVEQSVRVAYPQDKPNKNQKYL